MAWKRAPFLWQKASQILAEALPPLRLSPQVVIVAPSSDYEDFWQTFAELIQQERSDLSAPILFPLHQSSNSLPPLSPEQERLFFVPLPDLWSTPTLLETLKSLLSTNPSSSLFISLLGGAIWVDETMGDGIPLALPNNASKENWATMDWEKNGMKMLAAKEERIAVRYRRLSRLLGDGLRYAPLGHINPSDINAQWRKQWRAQIFTADEHSLPNSPWIVHYPLRVWWLSLATPAQAVSTVFWQR